MRIGKAIVAECPGCGKTGNYYWTEDNKRLVNGSCCCKPLEPEQLGLVDFETWNNDEQNFYHVEVETRWGETGEEA